MPRKWSGNAEGTRVFSPPFVGIGHSDCLQFYVARLSSGHAEVAWRWWEANLWSPPFCCSLAQQVWFKNRRAKWRRQKRSSSEESENAEKWNKASSKTSPEKREEEGKSDLDSDS